MSNQLLFQKKYRIPSTRRPGWDYTANGYYFVTIVTSDRICYFGDVIEKKMNVSNIGVVADLYARQIPDHSLHVQLDDLVVMPNHVHMVIAIDHLNALTGNDCGECAIYWKIKNDAFWQGRTDETGRDEALPRLYGESNQTKRISPKPGSLSTIIGSYKSACTKYIQKILNVSQFGWQERFHDHIIRDEYELARIKQYIIENPEKWDEDRFYVKYKKQN